MAERLGIQQPTMSRYLHNMPGHRNILRKIAESSGVSIEWLTTGKKHELAPEVGNIINKISAGRKKPAEDKDWLEIALKYLDEMKSLTEQDKDYIKDFLRNFLNDQNLRTEMICYWNYLRIRDKTPTMLPPKRKQRKKY